MQRIAKQQTATTTTATLLLPAKTTTVTQNSELYRVQHKKVAPWSFWQFSRQGLEFQCEILHTYEDNIYVHTGINTI